MKMRVYFLFGHTGDEVRHNPNNCIGISGPPHVLQLFLILQRKQTPSFPVASRAQHRAEDCTHGLSLAVLKGSEVIPQDYVMPRKFFELV